MHELPRYDCPPAMLDALLRYTHAVMRLGEAIQDTATTPAQRAALTNESQEAYHALIAEAKKVAPLGPLELRGERQRQRHLRRRRLC